MPDTYLWRNFIGLVLPLLWWANAAAGPVTVTWTTATLNTDGTTYSDPDYTRIYYGECEQGDIPASPLIQLAPHPDEQAVITLDPGDWCFRATHVNSQGEESVPSNVATFTVVAPEPPTGLTVGPDTTVYRISQTADRLVLVPTGTIPVGTPCDGTMSVNGRYVVPKDSVDYAGSVRPQVVVAECVSGN